MKRFKEGMLFCRGDIFLAIHLSKLVGRFRVKAVFGRYWSKEKHGRLDPSGKGHLEIYLDDEMAMWIDGLSLREVSRVFKKLGLVKTRGIPPNRLTKKHVWTNAPFTWKPRGHIDAPHHPSRE